jgi:hypothetical protein
MSYQVNPGLNLTEAHALALNVIDELLDSSTLHPRVKKEFHRLDACNMSDSELAKEIELLIPTLVNYPNICLLHELLWRFKCSR